MLRSLLCLLVLGALALNSTADEGIVKVYMNGGTIIIGTTATKTLPIKTKYGIMEVPLDEINGMNIGIHYEKGEKDQINKAIKSLGSGVYKDRDLATKDLVAFGRLALPLLPLNHSDSEVKYRAEDVAKKIVERFPDHIPAFDVVKTTEMDIKGEIQIEFLEIQTKDFGVLKPRFSNIAKITLQRSANGTATVKADGQWFDTGMHVEATSTLTVKASGQVELWPQGPGQYVANPKGYNAAGKGGQFQAGALIGKIGNETPFLIGEAYNSSPGKTGTLHLFIVESPWNNPSQGSYNVSIKAN